MKKLEADLLDYGTQISQLTKETDVAMGTLQQYRLLSEDREVSTEVFFTVKNLTHNTHK